MEGRMDIHAHEQPSLMVDDTDGVLWIRTGNGMRPDVVIRVHMPQMSARLQDAVDERRRRVSGDALWSTADEAPIPFEVAEPEPEPVKFVLWRKRLSGDFPAVLMRYEPTFDTYEDAVYYRRRMAIADSVEIRTKDGRTVVEAVLDAMARTLGRNRREVA